MRDDLKKIIIGILIICIVSLLSLTIYLIFFKLDKIRYDMEEIIVTQEKIVNQYDNLVGIYEFSEGERIVRLAINSDGTGEYQVKDTCGDSICTYEDVVGNIGISKNKIYLLNNDCNLVNVGDTCDYANCKPIITFDYSNEIVKIDGMTLIKK